MARRLESEGMPLELAERWIQAWEDHSPSSSTDRLGATFWTEAENWIHDERRTRRRLKKPLLWHSGDGRGLALAAKRKRRPAVAHPRPDADAHEPDREE
jgi:hypothetical protein